MKYIEKEEKQSNSSVGCKLFNVKQICEYLDISTNTLYQWTSRRKIPYIKLGGTLRFRPLEIDTWLSSKTVDPI